MHLPVEIGQAEVRGVERGQQPFSLRGSLAKAPRAELGIDDNRLPKQVSQRSQIVTSVRGELAFTAGRHRHADIALAESVWLELPATDALQVVTPEPQPITRDVSIDASNDPFAINNIESHKRLTPRRGFHHKPVPVTNPSSPTDSHGRAGSALDRVPKSTKSLLQLACPYSLSPRAHRT